MVIGELGKEAYAGCWRDVMAGAKVEKRGWVWMVLGKNRSCIGKRLPVALVWVGSLSGGGGRRNREGACRHFRGTWVT